jgi:hypothetical protein
MKAEMDGLSWQTWFKYRVLSVEAEASRAVAAGLEKIPVISLNLGSWGRLMVQ